MATNVRDDRVVHPRYVESYDLTRRPFTPYQWPLPLAVAGVALAGVGFNTAVTLLVVGGLVLLALAALWAFHATRARDAYLAAVSIDLWPLRHRQRLDERTVANDALWVAAYAAVKGYPAPEEFRRGPLSDQPQAGALAEEVDVVLRGVSTLSLTLSR